MGKQWKQCQTLFLGESDTTELLNWTEYAKTGFPGSSDGKESTHNSRDLGSIPGLARSPGEGHGNPLQYSCLKNPMDRGIQRATVDGVTESDMTEQLTLWLWFLEMWTKEKQSRAALGQDSVPPSKDTHSNTCELVYRDWSCSRWENLTIKHGMLPTSM